MNKYHYYLPEPTTPLGPVAEATHPGDASHGGEAAETALKSPVKNGATTETRSRHERKCSVCRHPDRDAIEEAFLHWQSPNQIASEYDLSNEASIYRHAHATGLFARRDNNLRFALANFIERVNEIQVVTPDAIVRAIRAYTRISKTGEWVEPPRQIVVTHVRASEGTFAPDPPQAGEGHVHASEDTFTPLALKPQAEGTRSGGNPPRRLKAGQKSKTKLNANRKSGLLANVANH